MANGRYSPDRSRRLALIRQVLLRAERDAELPEPLCVQALLQLHDAAELFLVLAAEATSAAVKAAVQFLEYWQPIDDKLVPRQLGHKSSMRAVSDARRGFKHSGVLPSRNEIQRFTRATREFLTDGAQAVFDVAFDETSLTELIPDAKVRNPVQQAERDLAAGELRAATGNAAIAFDALSRRHAPGEEGSDLDWRIYRMRDHLSMKSASLLKVSESVNRDFAQAWDAMLDQLKANEEAIGLVAKGIDYEGYWKFRALTPHVIWTFGSHQSGVPNLGFDDRLTLTVEIVTWCIEFVTVSALAWST